MIKQWIGDPPSQCDLSDKERGEAVKRMTDDLTAGKKPVPADKTPHFVLTIGAPGSGKHTMARACVEARGEYPLDSYVVLDFDALVKYHPRFNDMWHLPDMFGRPTDVGYAFSWSTCADFFDTQAGDFLQTALGQRYNLIVMSHWQPQMISAQSNNYFCTLLYVGAPLEVCVQRARSRAVATGKFIGRTLAAQDDLVKEMWGAYRQRTPWYALWADEFVAVANGVDGMKPAGKDFLRVDPHESPVWKESVRGMYDLLSYIHGEPLQEGRPNPWSEKKARADSPK